MKRQAVDVFDVFIGAGALLVAGNAWWITGHLGAGAIVIGVVLLVVGFIGVTR